MTTQSTALTVDVNFAQVLHKTVPACGACRWFWVLSSCTVGEGSGWYQPLVCIKVVKLHPRLWLRCRPILKETNAPTIRITYNDGRFNTFLKISAICIFLAFPTISFAKNATRGRGRHQPRTKQPFDRQLPRPCSLSKSESRTRRPQPPRPPPKRAGKGKQRPKERGPPLPPRLPGERGQRGGGESPLWR